MSSYLLETKVRIPHLRHDLVSRTDLIERLKAGLNYPLVLVSAPAGYGKTSLLAKLAEEIPHYHLDDLRLPITNNIHVDLRVGIASSGEVCFYRTHAAQRKR